VIINLQGVIKELVENSLDAGATNLNIRLLDYGSEQIEVFDNGKGIKEVDFAEIARRGSTSKLSTEEDLTKLKTLGFWGEALSSIANVARLTVLTRHQSEERGYKLIFNKYGEVESKERIHRAEVTTMIVNDLFSTIPVRFKAF